MIYTDTAQAVIMLLGALTLMVFSILEVGGWEDLKMKYANSIPTNTTLSKSFDLKLSMRYIVTYMKFTVKIGPFSISFNCIVFF